MTLLLLFVIGYSVLLAAIVAWLVRPAPRDRRPPPPPRKPVTPPVRVADGTIIGWMVRDPPANDLLPERSERAD
jgi:hypothetical protein